MLNKKLNMKDKLKQGLALGISLIMTINIYSPITAEASSVKTKRVTFIEQLNGQTRNQNVNITDVSEIVSARVVNGEGGDATAKITGKDTVQVSVSGGNASRSVYDSTKYSQYASDSRTSSIDSFPSSVSYSRGEYSGTLTKNGSSYVASGSYTPRDSKFITGQTSSYYNSDGYSGTLSSYVYSGSYTPGTPYEVTYYTGYCYNENGVRQGFDSPSIPCGRNGGYHSETHIERTYTRTKYTSGSDTRVYRYQGTVTKPEVDTRIWIQDYSGTIYQGGYDYYYKYEVDIQYIDDVTPPNITNSLSPSTWTNGNVSININATDSQSGVKSITLPNGTVVNGSSTTFTATSNGIYIFYATDNANNKSDAYVVTVDKIDREAPTNGKLSLLSKDNKSVEYNITGATDKAGFPDKAVEYDIKTETKDSTKDHQVFSGKVDGLKSNEAVKIKYRIKDIFNQYSAFTKEQTIYSLATQPTKAEIKDYSGSNINFKYTIPSQQNEAKYKFKAVSDKGDVKFSSVYEYDSLASIPNLIQDEKYKLYATAINNDSVENEYVLLKNDNGEDLEVITKNKTQITATKSQGFNKHTFVATVKDIDLDELKVELLVGNQVILLDKNLFKAKISDTRSLEISLDINGVGVNRSIEGTKDKFQVGIKGFVDNKYPVTLRTTKDGDIQTLDIGTFGIDTIGPVIEKPTITYLGGNKGLLIINTSSIKDLSSHLSEIQMDYGNGYENVRSQIITNKAVTTLKLKDKFGNESTTIVVQKNNPDGTTDPNDPNKPVDPIDPIDPNEPGSGDNGDEVPNIITDNNVSVTVPTGGTHMQTSLDGVTWSNWETRVNNVSVTLPSGDGAKSVHVRTGVQKFKETPIFNTETGRVEFITQEGGDVEPLNNTKISNFVKDLTAPKLNIRTMDNSLIAINGNITILLDVTDNLDSSPKFVVELLKRDGNGVLETKAPKERTFSGTTGTSSTGRLTLSKLPELRTNANKLQPYTLKVTAFDKYGNKTVEHLNFYSKIKK